MSSRNSVQGTDKPVLIVDPDIELLLEIKNHTAARRTKPILMSRADQAVHAIDQSADQLSAVLLNPELDGGKIVPVIVQRVLQVSPHTPIFYFCDIRVYAYDEEQLDSMSIQATIDRTGNYAEVLRTVIVGIEKARLKVTPKTNLHFLNRDVLTDDRFSPFSATNFTFGSMSYFDVYVRLSDGRYTQALRAGDTVSNERLDKYMAEGISTFFIRKDAEEHYRRFCEVLAAGTRKQL